VAKVVVFLDYPFRVHEMEQAVARAFRIGQTVQVYVYEFVLDTVEKNISSRAEEIMLLWKNQVAEILGTNINPKEVDGIVERLQLNNDPIDKALRLFRNMFR
jgi:SNF2 family DNA or RNA helicase